MSAFKNIDISQYLNQGILLLNHKGCILGWNYWLATHSGLSSAEVSGHFLLDIFNDIKVKPAFLHLMSAFKTHTHVSLSPTVHQYLLPLQVTDEQKKDIQYMYQLVQAQVIDISDSTSALLVTINDVTENYLLNKKIQLNFQEIQRQNKQLDLARQYASSFLANMSHELRTPLNSILVLSQLLCENKTNHLDENETEYITTINRSGKDLLKLINDVLDLAKVESGYLEIVKEVFELDDMIKSEKHIFEPLAMEREFEFTVNIANDVPKYFYGDAHRISQILRNFLSNAFKFTHCGEVSLSIERLYNYEPFVDALKFSVLDTGLGIEESKIHEIFKAFKQANGSISRQYGGTGLGLSISQELTELLGGKLLVKSREGEGSCFSLILPIDKRVFDKNINYQQLAQPDKKRIQKISATSHKLFKGEVSLSLDMQSIKNKKIIIVSNAIRDVYLLTATFEHLYMQVITIAESLKAIDIIAQEGVDVMLIDFDNSDNNTLQLIKEIRDTEEYFRLPIFVVSHNKNIIECKNGLADECFIKPIDLNLLTRMLAQYLL